MNKRNKALAAGMAGAIYGGICGALIGASFSGNALSGALIAGTGMAIAEAITDFWRRPGQLKPLLHRVISSTIFGGAVGAVVGSFANPLLTGLFTGIFIGGMSLGPRKLLAGTATGLLMGVVATAFVPINPAILGGSIVLLFQLLMMLLFDDIQPIELAGERVSQEDARFVVPFEAHTKHIGTGYMETLARDTEGAFKRNAPGIGLIDSLDELRGPHFDPALVDQRIRHFYEHTSDYHLTIIPHWNPLMKPFYGLFKRNIAQTIGQANLPFDIEEAQRGIVSYIDTIDYTTPDHIRTLRGWIRAFEATDEAIYVGIYTVVRHDDTGYVSVGFPLPEGNFTATLLPYNQNTHLLLKTQNTGLAFPGHYLSDIDNETGALTILKLPTFSEEIEVYIKDDNLKTDHRFYLGGFQFLHLDYTIAPKPTDINGH